jgi:hypothetical protein
VNSKLENGRFMGSSWKSHTGEVNIIQGVVKYLKSRTFKTKFASV